MHHEENSTGRLDSLNEDGSRKVIHPADVSGRFTRWRAWVRYALIMILLMTPLLTIHGQPLLLLDVQERSFTILAHSYNGQDAWLLFFLITGLGFALVVATSLAGRVWCGWACPQTVFVEGIYRRLERLIDGSRMEQIRLDKASWTARKLGKRALKYALFFVISSVLAHLLLGYFVPIRHLWTLLSAGPRQHPEAFGWVTALTALFFFDFGFFREQFCVVMCPYGRMQSLMNDEHSINIAYDSKRGEPRGKLKVLQRGDCIDCGRCVAVCPTGIDIRNGLQLDCIGCAACIDACDEVMLQVQQPKGLIRYDSEVGLNGGKTKLLRPRTYAYMVLGLAGLIAFSVATLSRTPYSVDLLRPSSTPFLLEAGSIHDRFTLHLLNKTQKPMRFQLFPAASGGVSWSVPEVDLDLPARGDMQLPLLASMPQDQFHHDFKVQIAVRVDGAAQRPVTASFLGP